VQAKRSVISDHYDLGEMLGEGGYGTVHIATRKRKSAGKDAPTTATAAATATAKAPLEEPALAVGGAGREDASMGVLGSQAGGEGKEGKASEGGVYVAVKKVSASVRGGGMKEECLIST